MNMMIHGFFNLINSTYRPNLITAASPFPSSYNSPEFLQGRLPVKESDDCLCVPWI